MMYFFVFSLYFTFGHSPHLGTEMHRHPLRPQVQAVPSPNRLTKRHSSLTGETLYNIGSDFRPSLPLPQKRQEEKIAKSAKSRLSISRRRLSLTLSRQ